jgi:predicted RNA-binding protein YlxR (DUF448 family)
MSSNQQPARRKHVPQRSCVICGEKRDKRSLVRIVRSAEGHLQLDPTGKLEGRGAYLCEKVSCWERAVSGQALNRALRMTLTDEDRKRLQQARP